MNKTALAAGAVIAITVASMVPSPFHAAKKPETNGKLLLGSQIDAATLSLVERACANCHSNSTQWRWYGYVFPTSWLLEWDVTMARKFMNLSRWTDYGSVGQSQLLDVAREQVDKGAMPPFRYLALHPEAWLSTSEKQRLMARFDQESRRLMIGQN